MCVCLWALSHSLFHQYIWSSSHAVRWPLTPRALSWRSLASVSAGVGGLPESKHGLFILTCLCIRPGEKTWKQRESEWVLKKLNFAIFHKWMLCRHKDHPLGSRLPGQNVQMQKESTLKVLRLGLQCSVSLPSVWFRLQNNSYRVIESQVCFYCTNKCAIILFYRL